MKPEARSMYKYWFWIIPLSLFVSAMLPLFLAPGMPASDGLVFGGIARNLANGLGSFWHPSFAKFHYAKFYDHPALGLSWLAWAYRLFGDHVAIEKIYSFVFTLLNWLLIYHIAKRFINNLRWQQYWLILTFWFLIAMNPWFYASNMQEPVANVFSLFALYLVIVTFQNRTQGWTLAFALTMAGVALCIGIYISGLLVLYVWLVEPCLCLVYSRPREVKHLRRWLMLVVSTALAFVAFVPAHQNFICYWNVQVKAALLGSRSNSHYFGLHRLHIVLVTISNMLPMLVVFGLLLIWTKARMSPRVGRQVLLMVLLYVISVFPIMLSTKQYVHYGLQGCPFIALACVFIIMPGLEKHLSQLWLVKKSRICLRGVLLAFMLMSVGVALYLTSSFSPLPQVKLYRESQDIIQRVGRGAIISSPYLMANIPFHLEVYLQRYGNISLQQQKRPTSKYLINLFPDRIEFDFDHYRIVPESRNWHSARLYERIK